MYIKEEFIKNNTIEHREYQVNIAKSASKSNTLVVLPTGMGKTIIALILISKILKKDNNGKVLFLAPTKPLVNQHADFLKNFLTIDKEKIFVFTGEVSPEDRKKKWKESTIVVSTPQVIKNDLLSARFSLSDVSFLIFDEAHHAVGDYAYVFVSEMYKRYQKNGLVFAITASPGGDIEKIREVCKNLDIDNIEIRTKYDPDVVSYVHDLKIEWKDINLPKDFGYTVQLLRKSLAKRLDFLKKVGVLESNAISRINKTNLLDAQRKIQKEIKNRVKPPKILFKAASVQSEAMKIHYALDLIQTQGVNALKKYIKRLSKESVSKGGSKASRVVMNDDEFLEAIAYAKSLNLEHPKIDKICSIVEEQLKKNSKSKIIVFTHYRDTSSFVLDKLNVIKNVKPVRFIGQAVKENDKGLTQKQQADVIKKFKKEEFNVLIATSVAEEGLDIPSTDLVVFYEPIPSEIRFIQRKGRTARKMPGKVIILITKGTSDEGYYWSAKRKEKNMRSQLELLRSKLDKEFKTSSEVFENKKNIDQKTIKDYNNSDNKDELMIVVDHREYRSNVVKNLALKNIFVEPRQLDVGDYVLSSRIGVERKNVDDFLESLIDGKLFKQIKRLKEVYSRPILILEGKNLFEKRNINHNAIFGSLACISVDYGVSILNTNDSNETADLLRIIAKREQKKHGKTVAIRGEKTMMSMRERQQFLIEGLPNVSSVIAKRLLDHFGSVKAIMNASEKDLQEVQGVGKGIASDIVKTLNAEYSIE